MLPEISNWTTYAGSAALFVSLGAFIITLLRFQQRALNETRDDAAEDRAAHRLEMAEARAEIVALRAEVGRIRYERETERHDCDEVRRELQAMKHVLAQNGIIP